MNGENLFISSKAVELSEDKDDDRYITLTNRLCYYDAPNLNDVILPSSNAEEIAQTLIEMPVVAKYRKNFLGNDDLGGHEMKIDKNGEVVWGTESIGFHKSVEIKDDVVEVNGETKTLPCLFATAKIWTRNKNFVNAIKRLYSEGGLFTSWEIETNEYEFKDGYKTLTDYRFVSNCCLGSGSPPAYGNASKTLNVASVEKTAQIMIAEALQEDLKEKVGETMEDIKDEKAVSENVEEIETPIEEEPIEDTEDKKIVKDLTESDILCEIQEKMSCEGFISYFFPIAQYVLVKSYETKDLDFVKVSYSVSDGEVSIVSEDEVTMTFSYAEVENLISEKDKEISEKESALVSASETISSLKREIAELEPIKAEYEKIQSEKLEQELSEKRQMLSNKIIKSGLFTESEINSQEIKEAISQVNEVEINSMIANKFISTLENKQETASKEVVKASVDEEVSSIELSEKKDRPFSVRLLWD